jgi:ArsR family transcriptional regulator
MELSERAKIYAALADPLRLRIVDHLKKNEVACGKELAAFLGASVALVSHHAKILEDAGLLLRRRDGQFIRFSLDRARLEELNNGGQGRD